MVKQGGEADIERATVYLMRWWCAEVAFSLRVRGPSDGVTWSDDLQMIR